MSNTQSAASSSFPVISLLGAVLVILKLLGKITISWFWVLAPFWISAFLLVVILFVILAIAILAAVVK